VITTDERIHESSLGDFPSIERIKNCGYEGTDNGSPVAGTVSDVMRDGETLTVYGSEGEIAFGLAVEWGSWYVRGATLHIIVPMIGTFKIRKIRP